MAKRSMPTDPTIITKRNRRECWSDMPAHLLGLILDRLPLSDHLRFRAVCHNWSLAAAENPYSPAVNPQPPWLMFHRRHSRLDRSGNCSPYFHNLSEKKDYPINLSRLRGLRCIGSSGGWLVALDRSSDLHLVNPITGTRLSLPPLTTFSCVKQAVRGPRGGGIVGYVCEERHLQNNDLAFYGHKEMQDYYNKVLVVDSFPGVLWVFVVLGHDGSVAYARAGVDECWTQPEHRYCGDGFSDIAVHKGKLYGTLYGCGNLVLVADLSSPMPLQMTSRYLSGCVPDVDGLVLYLSTRFYLVKSADGEELLLVRRYSSYPSTIATFLVFKLDSRGGHSVARWVKVEDLGDCAVFLGENQSFALSTRDLPELKPNCIYFTEIGLHGREESLPIRDAGVFNLRDGSISPCYDGQFGTTFSRFSRFPPHIWITPSLQ